MAESIPSKSTVLSKLTDLVSGWTKIYNANTKPYSHKNENLPGFDVYETILSQSDSWKPIPEASTKLFLYVPSNSTDVSQLRFRFENETLYHSLDNSMDLSKFDDYVAKMIEYKTEHRQVYFLATDFENTRIADTRIDDLEIKKVVQIPPEERLGITQPDLIASTNRLLYRDADAILKQNIELFSRTLCTLIDLIDPFKTKFINKTDFIELLVFLGIGVSVGELDSELFPLGTGAVVLNLDKLRPLLSEILLSKLVFHKAWQLHVTKRQDLEQKAKIMFKNKYKPLLDRFIAFLLPLAKNKTLTLQTVSLNLEKLKSSIFTDEQFSLTMKKIAELTVFDENSVRLIYYSTMISKLDGFVDEAMKLSRNPLETYLLVKLGYGKISQANFLEFCQHNNAIRPTKRQRIIIWKLLDLSEFLKDGLFDMNANVFILSYYIEHILKLNEYFNKEVDVPAAENMIDATVPAFLQTHDDFIGYIYSKWFNLVIPEHVTERCYLQFKEGNRVSMPLLFNRLEALNGLLKEWYRNFTILDS